MSNENSNKDFELSKLQSDLDGERYRVKVLTNQLEEETAKLSASMAQCEAYSKKLT